MAVKKSKKVSQSKIQAAEIASLKEQLTLLREDHQRLGMSLASRANEREILEGRLVKVEETSDRFAELFSTLRRVLQGVMSELACVRLLTRRPKSTACRRKTIVKKF